jgi:1-acyl-sn-glycerol-3-phosphate acyltransferase
MRTLLQNLILILFQALTRLEILNLENVPREGGCLLVCNHLGILDGPLYFAVLPRKDVTGLVADKYRRNPLSRLLVKAARGIWINRESSDFRALRLAANYLKDGGLLGVAPEGTRSPTGALIQGKPGAAFLAEHVGQIPILPAAVTGTEKIFSQFLRLRRPCIRLVFGETFYLPPVDRKQRSAALQKNTDEMMCRIAALLPPAYRGVYAHHPRLEELLATPNLEPAEKHFACHLEGGPSAAGQ